MIKSLNEINRTPGYSVLAVGGVNVSEIMSGQPVRLVDASTITIADGSLSAASYAVFGVAADTTTQHASGGKYTIMDDFAKNGLVSAYINGGLFEVWNDGRGLVFEADCIGAAVGSALYVSALGRWTTTAGSADTAGAKALGILISAPADASGVLKFQFNM